ncbi:amidohydrolase family protein [Pseudoalteromonas luteoviolacea]|uniref:Amidohydrolase-related domain-containing protein n=1 Tax=Pseudoalteromonas luteoviolacea S4054 TaxID=1129367 RepID=A0A0F6ACP4_9GAMM|nr:amidohydrolase family protein [Pseudoalteromonas luteoviolacea]AOT09648.1 hypothetical protein S4054249_18290 [Pseudoalteromonas luteoviolacea]AOT14561.1 hypothetical protein S40542_18260 [Pseudoalteromonas luteoviolacea]AOT19475.1 hypothetical protein S4054_18265 [Pseudoalteromonas luteoviolacea]KKE83913.1 hypothetical protein N479_10910 [Pseudoalteromonas luteoviolacea S4054]KZN77307.1 hypothetical protein N481_04450 [Pseudoalteromonas luteoviolacea S4047-1]
MKIIDPHLHFFDLDEGNYEWLKHNPPAWPHLDLIQQNHLPAALQNIALFKVAACVHVEAGFDNNHPLRELEWLANIVPPLPYKAVAYAQIDSPHEQFRNALHKLQHPSLVAIRDITEGDDAQRLQCEHTRQNLCYLAEQNIHFEAQFEVHNTVISRHMYDIYREQPAATLVINHAGFMTEGRDWQESIKLLSQIKNCVIKFSGHELLDAPIAPQHQLSALLTYFGSERIMLASNHPVCLIKHDYETQWQHYYELVQQVDSKVWHQLSFENAKRVYKLAV